MQSITQASANGIRWSQPHAAQTEYELRSGADLLATLKFRNMFGTFATAESADGCWTFKRVGFWQNRASIRACGSETDLAVFTNNTWDRGGTLQFPDGRTFKATTNFWMTNFEFRTGADEPLVAFDYGGIFHRSADVQVSPLGQRTAECPLLVLFGWYLVLMLDMANGAGAVVVPM
jgi:hypothetical protein